MPIPEDIDTQMWKALDEISDEVGHIPLGNNYVLFFEGWSPECFPSFVENEQDMIDYAIDFAPKIWKEWNDKMLPLGYKCITHEHNENLGLYGVTYALYRRRTK